MKIAEVEFEQTYRCMLDVFRLSIYFAENDIHEPEKLKCWYWIEKNAML